MGDFNLTPGQVPSTYASLEDLVIGPTAPSDLPEEQIDYIWLDPDPNVFPGYFIPYCEPSASDHCWTKGEAIWD